jgi:halimadienyl-diphosphate synthase
MAAFLHNDISPESAIINHGIYALSKAIQGLKADYCGATIGFELIVPSLVSEVTALGVSIETEALDDLMWSRMAKLNALPDRRIDRQHTPSFSAEAVGQDHLGLLDADNLQAPNGSVAFSPSATAFFAKYVRPDNELAQQYLDNMVIEDGAAPCVGPIEIFDRGWVAWNFSLDFEMRQALEPALNDYVEFLNQCWEPGRGVASGVGMPLYDGDDTALVYAALHMLGSPPDIETVLAYKAAYHFQCYPLESDPSISTNIHALHALRQSLPDDHAGVKTALNFLRRTRTSNAYWLDKWHASPYYSTSHAVIALEGLDNQMAADAVNWLLKTQRLDGSWGWYHYLPTVEETAYALQALSLWNLSHPNSVPRDALRRGYNWLRDNEALPYPPLWIGKSLYTPKLPVKAAILSARYLVEKCLRD